MSAICCYSSVNTLCVVIILHILSTPSTTQPLKVTYSSVKLPIPDSAHSPWYDGKDSIYLFGSREDTQADTKILRYFLSSDTIHSVGSLPVSGGLGSLHSDADGNIFYFGASSNLVIKYSPSTNTSTVVAQLPFSIYAVPTIRLDKNTVLILKEDPLLPEILSFDLALEKVTLLPVDLPTLFQYGAGVEFAGNKAYLLPVYLGTWHPRDTGSLWEMDTETKTFKKMDNISIPHFGRQLSMVTDSTSIYIIPGLFQSCWYKSRQGIFRIDPVAMTTEFLPVDNFPIAGDYRCAPAAVYVAKLNRVYFFGGCSDPDTKSNRHIFHDDIFYLDLNQGKKDIVVSETPTKFKFTCWRLVIGGENSICTQPENHTSPICGSSLAEDVSCNITSASNKVHNCGKLVYTLNSPSSRNSCDFVIDYFPKEITNLLECTLQNGVQIILSFTSTPGQHLNLTYSSARLPFPDHTQRLWYNGEDDVYIFGGFSSPQQILRYSLSSDAIYWVGALPIPVASGTLQSDEHGNVLYFMGGKYSWENRVVKYSPATNSSSVVAQLPHDIWGVPTIRLDGNRVVFLGSFFSGRNLLFYNLETGKMTKSLIQTPISFIYGVVLKFGKERAYLFRTSVAWSYMWEWGLEELTFSEMPDVVLPYFGSGSTVVTDHTWIYMLADFKTSQVFPENRGIFRIDPVARTNEFVHVDNWLQGNRPRFYLDPPRAVYIPGLNRIYGFGGRSAAGEDSDIRELDDIFYIDLSLLSKKDQDGNEVVANEKLAALNETGLKLTCSSFVADGETWKCSTSENQTNEIESFCKSKFAENVTCNRILPSMEHNEDEDIKLIIKMPSIEDDCRFVINIVLGDIGSRLNCSLDNGVQISLTFVPGAHNLFNYHFLAVGMLVILLIVILVTGWTIHHNKKTRKIKRNYSVRFKADENCERNK